MGIDWIRRTEEKFRHSLQEATRKRLSAKPLLTAEEQETVTYPCHWLHESKTVPAGTRLTIFQSSERARVAIMHGSEAVAEVRGEAARDLKELFRQHPECHNALAITLTRVSKPTEPSYVQPFTLPKRATKPIQ